MEQTCHSPGNGEVNNRQVPQRSGGWPREEGSRESQGSYTRRLVLMEQTFHSPGNGEVNNRTGTTVVGQERRGQENIRAHIRGG